MRFEWDEANVLHIAEHGLTPAQIEQVFDNDPLLFDFEYVDDEEHWSAAGIHCRHRRAR